MAVAAPTALGAAQGRCGELLAFRLGHAVGEQVVDPVERFRSGVGSGLELVAGVLGEEFLVTAVQLTVGPAVPRNAKALINGADADMASNGASDLATDQQNPGRDANAGGDRDQSFRA